MMFILINIKESIMEYFLILEKDLVEFINNDINLKYSTEHNVRIFLSDKEFIAHNGIK